MGQYENHFPVIIVSKDDVLLIIINWIKLNTFNIGSCKTLLHSINRQVLLHLVTCILFVREVTKSSNSILVILQCQFNRCETCITISVI